MLTLVLAACGGGGDDDQSPPPATSIAPPAATPIAAPAATPIAAPAAAPTEVAAPTVGPSQPVPQTSAPPATVPAAAPATVAVAAQSQLLIGPSCSLPELPADVLAQVNRARSASRTCGGQTLAPTGELVWDERLFTAAAAHSADMAGRNYFAHTAPDGRDPSQRAAAAGYGGSAAGENIAAGDSSVAGVMTTWLQSDGHCRNIMNPVFTEVALACVRGTASSYGTYWTMVLGRR